MKSAAALAGMALTAMVSVAASGSSRVVPWIPDQPPKFRVRALAPPCRLSDLRIGFFLSPVSGGGDLQGGVKVKHRATPRCSLRGTPSIRFVGSTRQQLMRGRLRNEGDLDGTLPRAALRSLGRGDEAYAAILWSNWCSRKPRGIAVDLPKGGGHIVLGLAKAPSCSSRRGAATLKVASFAPIESQPPLVPLRFSLPEQRLPVARAGHPFRYLIRLTNASRRVFRFGRCPVYTQAVLSSHTSKWEERILNCRPVGLLRSWESATFEMVIVMPASARDEWTSIDWALPGGRSGLIETSIIVRR
jgi:hypothetical protein